MSPREVQTPVGDAVAEYLRMPYTRMLVPDPDEGGFIAEVLELPGCMSQGETPDEAFNNLDDAMGGYIGSLLDRGYSVPEPVGMKEYPGRFLLRISSEQHRAAAIRAMNEGLSLNQWIGQRIAEALATKNLADELAALIVNQLVDRLPEVSMEAVRFQFRFGTAPGDVQANVPTRPVPMEDLKVLAEGDSTGAYQNLVDTVLRRLSDARS